MKLNVTDCNMLFQYEDFIYFFYVNKCNENITNISLIKNSIKK